MDNKNGHHGGNSFIWGLLIGAVLASLITTKRGRQIIRELTDLGIEIFENFAEDKMKPKKNVVETSEDEEDLDEASDDLASEVTEEETVEVTSVEGPSEVNEPAPAENGHAKKRLFKGIRRK